MIDVDTPGSGSDGMFASKPFDVAREMVRVAAGLERQFCEPRGSILITSAGVH